MNEKVLITSSHLDAHNTIITPEAIKNSLTQLQGKDKMRCLVNHRRDLPPIGKMDNPTLHESDGHVYLFAERVLYENKGPVEWDPSLVYEAFNSECTFISREPDDNTEFAISLDPNNFKTPKEYQVVAAQIQELASEEEIPVHNHMRKSQIPDPELIIHSIVIWEFVKPLAKPFIKKVGEKVAEDVGDEIYDAAKKKLAKLANYVYKAIGITRRNAVPKNKTLITIFEIAGDPYVELHAKSDDAYLVSKALTETKLAKVRDEIERLSKHVQITEIHFNLNEKGQWQFSYLITDNGSTIGTKACFKQRDRLYNRILLRNGLNPRNRS